MTPGFAARQDTDDTQAQGERATSESTINGIDAMRARWRAGKWLALVSGIGHPSRRFIKKAALVAGCLITSNFGG